MNAKLAFQIIAVAVLLFSAPHLTPSAYGQTDGEEEPTEFVPDYEIVEGNYVNEELGFSFTLPAEMNGYLTDSNSGMYFGSDSRFVGIQIHTEFNSTDPSHCCPAIDTAPAVFLFESGSLENLNSPVPLTGDLFAAIQGYGMRLNLDENDNGIKSVLAATLRYDRGEGERVGKFYLANTDEMFVSYGILGSQEGYARYLDEFEKSAQSLTLQNITTVALDSIFDNYVVETANVTLADGSTLTPLVAASGVVDDIRVNEDSKSFSFQINEVLDNGFFILQSNQILEGPLTATVDGQSAEDSDDLSTDNAHYLVLYYDGQGSHKLAVTGTRVVPEFPSILIIIALALAMVASMISFRLNNGPRSLDSS
jgi:hypothetical protein